MSERSEANDLADEDDVDAARQLLVDLKRIPAEHLAIEGNLGVIVADVDGYEARGGVFMDDGEAGKAAGPPDASDRPRPGRRLLPDGRDHRSPWPAGAVWRAARRRA